MSESQGSDELEQNTKEWLDFRRSRLGSSDAAVVLGISPWKTRYQLWAEKTMRDRKKESKGSGNTFAMDRGTRLEPAMRALHELRTGLELEPSIVVHPEHPFIMSSLDAYNKEAGIIGEYKVCGEKVFSLAKNGIVIDYYYAQVQEQLMCTLANECHFIVGSAKEDSPGHPVIVDTATVIVKPDLEYQKNLLFEMVSFYDFVMKDVAPPLCDRDTVYPDDQSTMLLFGRLKKLKLMLAKAEEVGEGVKVIKERFDEVKLEVIDHVLHEIKHPKVSAAGVSLNRNKNGSWVVRLD